MSVKNFKITRKVQKGGELICPSDFTADSNLKKLVDLLNADPRVPDEITKLLAELKNDDVIAMPNDFISKLTLGLQGYFDSLKTDSKISNLKKIVNDAPGILTAVDGGLDDFIGGDVEHAGGGKKSKKSSKKTSKKSSKKTSRKSSKKTSRK